MRKYLDAFRASRLSHLLAALLAALVAVGVTVVVDDPGDGHRTVTIHVGKTATAAPAGDLEAPGPDSKAEAQGVAPAQSALRDETPAGVSAGKLADGAAATEDAGDEYGVTDKPLPVGGAQNYHCRQDFTGHVYSDFYAGLTPTEFALHYTVSPNVAGWGDVLGVQGYFVRSRVGSATFILDFEGHCLQMVPLSAKAWTQGAMNPKVRASVEIIATGSETRAEWLAAPIFRRGVLASLMSDVMRKYNLPLKFVDPSGCYAPPGYTDHHHYECGNDHTDVAPSFPFDVLARQLRAGVDRCGPTCQNMRPRHRHVHHDLHRVCRHSAGRRRHPKVCGKLTNRNHYLHRYARAHKFELR